MAKYCGKCGSKLDEATGLCPKCDAEKLKQLLEKSTEPTKEIEREPEITQPKDVPLTKKEAKAKRKADQKVAKKERKADQKVAKKERKAQKKAAKKAKKKEKWASKPWWKKILSLLLRCIGWILLLSIAAVGIISVLGHFGIVEIPVAEDVLVSLGFAEQYHVTPPDADEYFNSNSKVISVIDANMSDDVPTEAQTFETLTERGFTEFSITSDYTMDGTYYDAADISETSTSKHPVYETYYVTESGDVWTIIVINSTIMANPVSYNLQSNLGVQVIISETDTVTSYDSTTNQFYETIPHNSELIVKTVKKIDADTLEALTYGVIDGL